MENGLKEGKGEREIGIDPKGTLMCK